MAVSSTLRALVVLLTPVKLAGVAHAFFQKEKLSCVISLATRLTVFFAYAYIARPLLHLVLFSFQGLYTLIFHVASSWCTMYFFCSNSNKNNNNTPSAEKNNNNGNNEKWHEKDKTIHHKGNKHPVKTQISRDAHDLSTHNLSFVDTHHKILLQANPLSRTSRINEGYPF